MTFSFYYSLKALPDDFKFVGRLARFTPWQRFTQIELPFASKGLVYNSMVSMAGGWFFLSIIEAFQLNSQDYRVRGLGSYMSVAQQQNNFAAQAWDVVAMIVMIVLLDQLVWRPLIVWSNKFKMEDTEAEFQDRSAVLDYLGRSRLGNWLHACGTKLLLRREGSGTGGLCAGRARRAAARRRGWRLVPWSKIFLGVGAGRRGLRRGQRGQAAGGGEGGRVAGDRLQPGSDPHPRAGGDRIEHAHRGADRGVDRVAIPSWRAISCR